jgi:acylphosphatase
MTVKRRILIKGRKVHNVGYRPFLMERAQELKIPNFHAKNIKENGKQVVDVRVGGEGGRIDKFLKFVNENWPEFAEVENISVEEKEYEEDIMTLEDFSGLLSALQLSKIVQAGLGMVEMQKLTIEMQKQALGKHDQTLDKQDSMLDKQDQTLTVIKSGVNEMRESREENKTLLRDFHHDTIQRFDNLDAKYGKIAENMERILEELKEERKEYRETVERLVNAIIESRKEK